MKFILVLALLGFSLSAPAIERLSDGYHKVKFPKYTLAQKQFIIDQTILLVGEANVNRRIKMEKFGSQIDPLPRLHKIKANLENLSAKEFNYQIVDVFNSQRDKHLNFHLPRPHSCYSSILPLSFHIFQKPDSNGQLKRVVTITKKRITKGTSTLLTEEELNDFDKIERGDILVSYDNLDFTLPIQETLKDLITSSSGSNGHGGLASAANRLSYRWHKTDKLKIFPFDENPLQQSHLTFEKPDGTVYQVKIPWLLAPNDECLITSGAIENDSAQDDLSQVVNQTPDDFEDVYENTNIVYINDPLKNKDHIGYRWGYLEHKKQKYGYIRIHSFSMEGYKTKEFPDPRPYLLTLNLAGVLHRLNQEFNVRGLILDVRNNGGGSLSFSERITQFFSPRKVSPTKYRMLNSDFNRKLVTRDIPNPPSNLPLFSEQLLNAKPKQVYTKPIEFYGQAGPHWANAFGQRFYKPVVVLANSRCYSACDKFTSQMQDMGAAPIWSEGLRTGGGGANVVGDDFFRKLAKMGETPEGVSTEPMPFGHGIRVPWRQIIRSGKNAGKRLEEDGVVADRSLLKSWADFMNNRFFHLDELIEHFEIQNLMQELEFQVDVPQFHALAQPGAPSLEIPIHINGVKNLQVVREQLLPDQQDGFEEVNVRISLNGELHNSIRVPLPPVWDTQLKYRLIGKQGQKVLFNTLIHIDEAELIP